MSYYDYRDDNSEPDYDDYDYDDPRDYYDSDDHDDYDPRDDCENYDWYDSDEQHEAAEAAETAKREADELADYLSKLRVGKDVRRYGYFRCKKCSKTWSSAAAYCIYKGKKEIKGSDGKMTEGEAIFEPRDDSKQMCSKCNIYTKPYRTEKLKVPTTVSTGEANKAHRRDLCERCNTGRSCLYA